MARVSGEALVVSVAPFGEGDALVRLLCRERGLMAGLVKARGHSARGGSKGAVLQPFNTVRYEHYRRLDTQLGTLTLELEKSRAALWAGAHGRWAVGMAYLSEMLAHLLPEEQECPGLFERVEAFLAGCCGWREVMRFELELLEMVGYGLRLGETVGAADLRVSGLADLRKRESGGEVACTRVGGYEDTRVRGGELAYVSPSSGRTVTREAACGWEARLLELPHALGGPACSEEQDFGRAWRLTGAFLEQALHGRQLAARGRLERVLRGGFLARAA